VIDPQSYVKGVLLPAPKPAAPARR